MCLAQGPQRSDAGEARTRYPSVSSQALYHWATVLPWHNTVTQMSLELATIQSQVEPSTNWATALCPL